MGADLINLRRARKAKGKAEKAKAAEANRVLHGTPTRLKKLADAQAKKAQQALSGHRLEPDK